MIDTDRRIDYLPLDEVPVARVNPKRHDIEAVKASIRRFGFATPALRDERTGRLVAGHGRHEALRELRDAGQLPPAGVRLDPAGRWLVPVICGWASNSDAEADAYLVIDNRHPELGGWDYSELGPLLAGLSELDPELLAVTGYSDTDLADMLAGLDAGDDHGPGGSGTGDPDAMPEPPAAPYSKLGDVWRIGPHRLLCGDSTDAAAVQAMLAGDRADCMWTDPPYGVNYNDFATIAAARKARRRTDGLRIKNDSKPTELPELLGGAFRVATSALQPGAPVYIAHPAGALSLIFGEAITNAGWSLRQQLVWVKNALALGHNDYHYRHEPIWLAYTPGGEGRRGRSGEHPTMKPVALITAMLHNSCAPRGLVYDPFGGSGSTMIAAHELGIRAALVELDPTYVDVICRRLQEYTGLEPIHGTTGETHDFTREKT